MFQRACLGVANVICSMHSSVIRVGRQVQKFRSLVLERYSISNRL